MVFKGIREKDRETETERKQRKKERQTDRQESQLNNMRVRQSELLTNRIEITASHSVRSKWCNTRKGKNYIFFIWNEKNIFLRLPCKSKSYLR